MRETGDTRHRRGWIAAITAAGAVTLAPLAAMQVTDAVAWGPGDFLLAGSLVLGAGLACNLAARAHPGRAYAAGATVALGTAVLLVWATGAVGFFGAEHHPANRMLVIVLAVGAVGPVLARLRPRGMARALVATALAQALVGGIGSTAEAVSRADVLFATAGFTGLWLLSAWLFHRVARQRPAA